MAGFLTRNYIVDLCVVQKFPFLEEWIFCQVLQIVHGVERECMMKSCSEFWREITQLRS